MKSPLFSRNQSGRSPAPDPTMSRTRLPIKADIDGNNMLSRFPQGRVEIQVIDPPPVAGMDVPFAACHGAAKYVRRNKDD